MTRPTGPARHAGGMNIYLINALLVLLVVRQVREHQLDLRALAVPVLAVGAAAVMFLHSVPGGGSDIALDLLCLSAGAALGAVGGLATHLRAGAGGRPLGRAGVLAASMWIAGVGARMVFYFAATHGAGPAIARFSVAHHITGPGAWTAALVMMALADVLTRLAVVYLRGRRLPPAPRSSRHLPRPRRRLASPWPAQPHRPDQAPPTAAPYSCHLTARSVPAAPRQKRWACQRPGSPRPVSRPRVPATGSGRQRTGQACDAPPSSCSPVASMTTTANVPDNSRRHDRPPRRQMTASTAS